jgi:hypothetical protein
MTCVCQQDDHGNVIAPCGAHSSVIRGAVEYAENRIIDKLIKAGEEVLTLAMVELATPGREMHAGGMAMAARKLLKEVK